MIVSKKSLLALVCLGLMVGCSSKFISNDSKLNHKNTIKVEKVNKYKNPIKIRLIVPSSAFSGEKVPMGIKVSPSLKAGDSMSLFFENHRIATIIVDGNFKYKKFKTNVKMTKSGLLSVKIIKSNGQQAVKEKYVAVQKPSKLIARSSNAKDGKVFINGKTLKSVVNGYASKILIKTKSGSLIFNPTQYISSNIFFSLTGDNDYKNTVVEIPTKTIEADYYDIENKWSPIDYSELYQLISGKTLIGGHKRYCPDNVKNKTCIKIAVLQSIEERTKGEKLKSTVIIPDRKKIIEGEWGYIPYNTFTHGLHIGIDLLPVGSSKFSFRENVSVNKNKNKIKIRNPRTKDVILISIVEGKNNQYLADAKNHNYKKINNRGMLSLSQQISKKILSSIGKALKEGAEYARTHPNANNSTNIENTKDVKSQTSSSKSSTPQRAKGGVKRVYVGSRSGGYAHYVVNCNNGKSHYDLTQKSNGYWHKGGFMSNMGDDYKGLSINEVAEKLCR